MLRYDLQDTQLLSKSLLSFYVFTESATVSACCVKGKLKSLKLIPKNQKYMNELSGIRNNPDISDEQLKILQTFLCDVYGHEGDRVNLLTCLLYSLRQGKLEAKLITPCFFLGYSLIIIK